MLLCTVWLCTGCFVTRHVPANKSLVTQNKFAYGDNAKVTKKGDAEYYFKNSVVQKPNTKYLRLFRFPLWVHYKTLPNDKTFANKVQQWAHRKVGEPPTYLDSAATRVAARTMQVYFQKRGYFDTQVSYEVRTRRKKAEVTYHIKTGKQYTIDTLEVISDDLYVRALVENSMRDTKLKKGDPLDEANFQQEKIRITKYLRNRGYAFFTPNYISNLEADSTRHQLRVKLKILSPTDSTDHQQFYVGNIYVYPDIGIDTTQALRYDTIAPHLYFVRTATTLPLKPTAISNVLLMKYGDLYLQDNVDKTSLQFVDFEILKFFNIKPFADTTAPDTLHFNIFLTTDKPIEIGADVEVNTSNFNSSTSTLFGTALNISTRNKNLLRGAEVFSANLQGGVELNFFNRSETQTSLINTLTVGAESQLFVPRFIDPLRLWRGISKISLGKHQKLIDSRFYNLLRQRANTKFGAAYNYLSFVNFYSYHALNATFGYQLQYNKNVKYEINQLGINYLSPTFATAFEALLDRNIFLKRSFSKQLFAGLLFNNLVVTYATQPNPYGETWFIRGDIEQSGAEILGINALYNRILGQTTPFQIDKTEFAHFWKLKVDMRYTRNYANKTGTAFRLALGAASPFGKYTKVVPYVKQFFLGGPNSIRAWRIRQLGPGSYYDEAADANNNNGLPFYQAADLLLEFNAEYRFNLFWRFKGAIFLEGGNIWTLKRETTRPGSLLKAASYKEIALGTGFGTRIDFSFFLLRLDMGYRLRNPYERNGSHWAYTSLNQLRLRDINYNLAIGYPF